MKHKIILMLAICSSMHIQASESVTSLSGEEKQSEHKLENETKYLTVKILIQEIGDPQPRELFNILASSSDNIGSLKPIVRNELNFPKTRPINFVSIATKRVVSDNVLLKDIQYSESTPQSRSLLMQNSYE